MSRADVPRLGRGLSSLLGPTAGSGSESGVRSLATARLAPGPFQPRGAIDPDSLAPLADSIRTNGILQPLLARPDPVTPGQFQLIAGERRWRAAQMAGLHEVPVLVRPLSDTDAMAAALVENLQRVDLDPIEEAEGFRRLLDEFGLTHEALAEAVGKSRSHVTNTLRLLNLPETVRSAVRRGALSAGHARALLAHPDPEAAANAVIAGDLSVRQTEALANQRPKPASPEPVPDPNTTALERRLSDRLGLRVEITGRGRGGSLRIAFQTLDQLDGVVAQLMGET
jgi:ParB family chromosome partitioning protein